MWASEIETDDQGAPISDALSKADVGRKSVPLGSKLPADQIKLAGGIIIRINRPLHRHQAWRWRECDGPISEAALCIKVQPRLSV